MPLQTAYKNLLTICRKARKLEAGFERAKEALQTKTASCLILTADLSEKSKKEIHYYGERYSVPVLQTDWTMAEIKLLIGQRSGILTICDAGFAKRIQEMMQTEHSA